MNSVSLELFATIAAATAATAQLVLAARAVRTRQQESDSLAKIASADELDLVASMSAEEVGSYLFNTLGEMTLDKYSRDSSARKFVARAVSRVEDLMLDGEARSDLDAGTSDTSNEDQLTELMKLRLGIETELRRFGVEHNVSFGRESAYGMVQHLGKLGLISRPVALSLARAIRVSNAVIHGEKVEPQSVMSALENGRRALAELFAA